MSAFDLQAYVGLNAGDLYDPIEVAALGTDTIDSNATTQNFTIDFGTGAAGDLYVAAVGWVALANRTVSSVTFDQGGGNIAGTLAAGNNSALTGNILFYTGQGNLSGSKTVRMVMSGATSSTFCRVWRLRNWRGAAPISASLFGGSGSSTGDTLTVDDGGCLLACAAKGGTAAMSWTGATEDWEAQFNSGANWRVCTAHTDDLPAQARAVSCSWSGTLTNIFGGAAWR